MATVRIRGPLGRAPQQATLISGSVGDKARSVNGRPKSQPSLMAPEPIAETHTVAAKKKSPPWRDGEVNVYVFTDLPDETTDKTKEFLVDDLQKLEMDIDHTARAVFINGMGNTGQDNMESSCILSLLLMRPVISVYNRESDFWGDLGQCLRDKINFQGWPINPAQQFKKLAERENAKSLSAQIRLMQNILGTGRLGNRATASLFGVLAEGEGQDINTPIYAHSQGNLILSNALQALKIVKGKQALMGRKVYSYGSPAVVWPKEIEHYDHAFTFDLVSLLNVIPSWSISKLGWPDGTPNPFTHGFLWYLQEDAAFIINRFRVGGWGATLHLDEEKLAKELVSFGKNEQRLRRIFARLDKYHNSDVDDVAEIYVNLMKSGGYESTLKSMKLLVKDLIRYMEEGWTSSGEQAVIDYLKSL